jgi:hypothetical protein
MLSKAKNVAEYLKELPPDRELYLSKLRATILKNIPKGFEEVMSYGMIGYVVPHSIFPDGYHCNPLLPLPFITIASQKNFIALYHMGLYANPALLEWFIKEYPQHSKSKIDVGKSCVRFKKLDQIPYDLIAELLKKISVKDWITLYQKSFVK